MGNDHKNLKRSTEEWIVMLFCVTGAVIVAPFIPLRLLEGDDRLAFIDILIVVGLMGIGIVTWRTNNIQITRWLLNGYCMLAVIATVYAKGAVSVYWVFPMAVISFFLSRISHACWINGLGLIVLLPIILRDKALGEALVIVAAFLMTNVVAFIFASRTNQQRDLLAKMATIDYLTGVKNRRALSQKLKESVEIKRRKQEHVSAILLDIDHFKETNDTYGHATGDELLVRLCSLVGNNIRLTDRLYRFGGEEFIVILRGSTMAEAMSIAEKLRVAVLRDERLKEYGVSISLGVGELEEDESENQWLKRVDAALYKSKKTGRNRATLAELKREPVVC